jgi:hypothetical protein
MKIREKYIRIILVNGWDYVITFERMIGFNLFQRVIVLCVVFWQSDLDTVVWDVTIGQASSF